MDSQTTTTSGIAIGKVQTPLVDLLWIVVQQIRNKSKRVESELNRTARSRLYSSASRMTVACM